MLDTTVCMTYLIKYKKDRRAIKQYSYSVHLMDTAAIMDFKVGVGDVLLTFLVRNPTSWGIPVLTGNLEIPTSQYKWNALLHLTVL